MRLVLLLDSDAPFVLRMRRQSHDLDGDGLVVGGADDAALQGPHGPNGGEEIGGLGGRWRGLREE